MYRYLNCSPSASKVAVRPLSMIVKTSISEMNYGKRKKINGNTIKREREGDLKGCHI